jgi:hypothetical protein
VRFIGLGKTYRARRSAALQGIDLAIRAAKCSASSAAAAPASRR